MMRLNIGCGKRPTDGWNNYDNSFSLRLARWMFLSKILYKLGLIVKPQYEYIQFANKSSIQYCDVTKGLAQADNTVDAIYSSHMLEHLDRREASGFLKESYRVLCSGGVIRLSVPCIQKMVQKYNETGDADEFIDSTQMCVPKPRRVIDKIRFVISGSRHHQWMYDGKSLGLLLEKHGFIEPIVLPEGKTTIKSPGELDLYERSGSSVYVEASVP